VIEAVPLVSVALPSGTPPSSKETVPSGVPAAELTVAVKVSASPYVAVEGDTESTVLVFAAGFTNWIKLAVEVLKFWPAKVAVTLTFSTIGNVVVAVAVAVGPDEIWTVL
jgi:hypothetical protein